MNIALIGYRGTGKSTIGKILAEYLGFIYVSFDEEIIRRAGMPVTEIVATHSWDYFRDLEEQVTQDLTSLDRHVLDTGGGIITRPRNIDRLRRSSLVFLLEATVEDIIDRIGGDSQRPSLTGTKSFVDEIVEVLSERQPLYEQAAHHRINTSRMSPAGAAEEVLKIVRGLNDSS